MMEVYARTYKVTPYTDLKSAVMFVAIMGGYMNRKHDPPPGMRSCGEGMHDYRCGRSHMRN